MKLQDIQIGRIYHDGKQGLREVVGIKGSVRYRLLAAKVERQFGRNGQPESLLGRESEVTMGAFAAWAKVGYSAEEGRCVLLRLQAAKVKLSLGEEAFLTRLLDEVEGRLLGVGSVVSYDHTEGRAVAGLEKKGLLRRVGGRESEVLPLGAGRLVAMALA